jgi:hypothetical protein
VLWPDNELPVSIMQRVGYSKWNHAGMAGVRVGLQWDVVIALMDRQGLTPREWEDLHDDLVVMEDAALATMREFEPKPKK